MSLDPEIIRITTLSLAVSLTSTALSAAISIPLGTLIYYREFFGKRMLINIIQTLYALPTVLAGLLLFLLLSNQGPLGPLGLLFTPTGMILAQMILVTPLIVGLTISALSGIDREMRNAISSLGATTFQSILTLIQEARFAILAAVILGFGRAISEVGAAMIIGGNIRGYSGSLISGTRVLTTAISLETSQGDFAFAIALGIILLGVAVVVNLGLNIVQSGFLAKNSWTS
ncbi:MAG: ABC transporter permease [Methanoregulaceae archaeon]|nr:ABC transporter permease [Methanoregulaceae archaeon]